MEKMIIYQDEMSALNGLPFIQRLVYLQGIRPYVDYQTGIVGLKRGISYQSLAETLYVEPHQGIQSGSPSKDQLRRALKGLERAGLLEIHSSDKKLILKCLLLKQHHFIQNKLATNPHHQTTSVNLKDNQEKSIDYSDNSKISAIPETLKPAIPHNSNNYYIFLLGEFEKFWERYPNKKSQQKAWQVFQELNPTPELVTQIHISLQQQIDFTQQQQAYGKWIPNWKNPANWLAQHCWKDEFLTETTPEHTHAFNQRNHAKQVSTDPFWDSCKSGLEPEIADNIITLNDYRKGAQTY